MVRCTKLKMPDGLNLNYDNLYIIPTNEGAYTALYGDLQYFFTDSEINELWTKLNAATSLQLSEEDLLAVVEKLNTYKGE